MSRDVEFVLLYACHLPRRDDKMVVRQPGHPTPVTILNWPYRLCRSHTSRFRPCQAAASNFSSAEPLGGKCYHGRSIPPRGWQSLKLAIPTAQTRCHFPSNLGRSLGSVHFLSCQSHFDRLKLWSEVYVRFSFSLNSRLHHPGSQTFCRHTCCPVRYPSATPKDFKACGLLT